LRATTVLFNSANLLDWISSFSISIYTLSKPE
jgi:hypothetical protein